MDEIELFFELALYFLNNIRDDPPYEYYLYLLVAVLGVFLIFIVTFLIIHLSKQKYTEQLPVTDDEITD